jgi:hypothetical protein
MSELSTGVQTRLQGLLNQLVEPTVNLRQLPDAESLEEGLFATLVNHRGAQVGSLAAGPRTVTHLGASLAEIGPDKAREMIAGDGYPPMLRESMGEIFNVCTQCFMGPETVAISIDRIAEGLFDGYRDAVSTARIFESYSVELEGYGEGQLDIGVLGTSR